MRHARAHPIVSSSNLALCSRSLTFVGCRLAYRVLQGHPQFSHRHREHPGQRGPHCTIEPTCSRMQKIMLLFAYRGLHDRNSLKPDLLVSERYLSTLPQSLKVYSFKDAEKKYGKIDHVLANAVIPPSISLLEDDVDASGDLLSPNLRTFNVNLLSCSHRQTSHPPHPQKPQRRQHRHDSISIERHMIHHPRLQ